MPSLNGAYLEAIRLCNSTDPYCRYSQKSNLRGGTISGGYQWFDCSGFIWYVLKKNGFSVGSYPFSTSGEVSVLTKAGFVEEDINGIWKNGDVLWRRDYTTGKGHTEMVYRGAVGRGITMGAHDTNPIIADEVSIKTKYSSASSYMKLLRYNEEVGPTPETDWVYKNGNEYLNVEEKLNNGKIIYQYFSLRNWSLNSICGMLGNFELESRNLNPKAESSTGTHIGLAQWGTSYIYNIMDTLYGSHTEWWNGYNQLGMINAQYDEYVGTAQRGIDKQWSTQNVYAVRWEDYINSTEDVEYLARVFWASYEKSSSFDERRATFAKEWYEYLQNIDPGGGGGEGSSRRPLPLWMMTRRL